MRRRGTEHLLCLPTDWPDCSFIIAGICHCHFLLSLTLGYHRRELSDIIRFALTQKITRQRKKSPTGAFAAQAARTTDRTRYDRRYLSFSQPDFLSLFSLWTLYASSVVSERAVSLCFVSCYHLIVLSYFVTNNGLLLCASAPAVDLFFF